MSSVNNRTRFPECYFAKFAKRGEMVGLLYGSVQTQSRDTQIVGSASL